ncbi:fimbrial protein [Atlantibacter sp. RC6]|uniref:fimbrial protein n=1 Tax=Atlantibacter sp. RC6 TaxID=2587036 RepID=UPI001605D4F7|nr:fimbrial protein [Atlantibacter sp. RC6]MBB3320768.1 hypothetical protein [Atlantibacter sp. RC6]
MLTICKNLLKCIMPLIIFLSIIVFLLFISGAAKATVTGVYGFAGADGYYDCSGRAAVAYVPGPTTLFGPLCQIKYNLYVPHSGYYKVKVDVFYYYSNSFLTSGTSGRVYFDGSKSLAEQNVDVSGPAQHLSLSDDDVVICRRFIDDDGNIYDPDSESAFTGVCGHYPQLSPQPVVPDTSCIINYGNTLTVSLGIIERAELPTISDTTTAQKVQIPVECTGGDVTVSMKLNYNPMTMGSSQAVQTTANGVGVTISYNNTPISTTDTTTLTFLEGLNTLDLDFQAVRDSEVNVADVPTGGFSASAAIVMTQQ